MVHCVMTPLVAEDEIYTSLNVIYKSEWIPFHKNDQCHKAIQTQTLVFMTMSQCQNLNIAVRSGHGNDQCQKRNKDVHSGHENDQCQKRNKDVHSGHENDQCQKGIKMYTLVLKILNAKKGIIRMDTIS